MATVLDSDERASKLTQRGLAVACVSIARYLRGRDPEFGLCMLRSLKQAEAVGLAPADLELMRTIIKATAVTAK